jgi:hypothetical protein
VELKRNGMDLLKINNQQSTILNPKILIPHPEFIIDPNPSIGYHYP